MIRRKKMRNGVTASNLDPPLGGCPCDHVLRSGQLPHWRGSGRGLGACKLESPTEEEDRPPGSLVPLFSRCPGTAGSVCLHNRGPLWGHSSSLPGSPLWCGWLRGWEVQKLRQRDQTTDDNVSPFATTQREGNRDLGEGRLYRCEPGREGVCDKGGLPGTEPGETEVALSSAARALPPSLPPAGCLFSSSEDPGVQVHSLLLLPRRPRSLDRQHLRLPGPGSPVLPPSPWSPVGPWHCWLAPWA